MTHPDPDFFLAVAGAIPLLLIVLLAENKLKFGNETPLGRLAWFILIASAIIGEIAALRALAWPPPGTVYVVLAALGLLFCLTMVLLLFIWQVLNEMADAGRTVKRPEPYIVVAVAAVILGGGAVLIGPLL